MKKIKVIHCKCNEPSKIIEVKDELHALQELVGGYIETVNLDNGLILVCNEEGKLKGLKHNGHAELVNGRNEAIRGDFFVCRVRVAEFISVEDGDFEKLNNHVFRSEDADELE